MSASGDGAGQFDGVLNPARYPPVRRLSSVLRGLCRPLLCKE